MLKEWLTRLRFLMSPKSHREIDDELQFHIERQTQEYIATGHIRTVPMLLWVKAAVDHWTSAANVVTGRIFRAVSRHGRPWGKGISESVI